MTRHEAKLRRIRRVEKAVGALTRMNLVYKLGGARLYTPHQEILGPGAPGTAWTDCSGFALYLLAVAGVPLRNAAGWTGTLVNEGRAGTSEYLTLYLKGPTQTEGHVIVRLRKRPRPWHRGVPRYRWAECGGNDNPRAGGGPTWFRPSRTRIAEFPFQRRFEQL